MEDDKHNQKKHLNLSTSRLSGMRKTLIKSEINLFVFPQLPPTRSLQNLYLHEWAPIPANWPLCTIAHCFLSLTLKEHSKISPDAIGISSLLYKRFRRWGCHPMISRSPNMIVRAG